MCVIIHIWLVSSKANIYRKSRRNSSSEQSQTGHIVYIIYTFAVFDVYEARKITCCENVYIHKGKMYIWVQEDDVWMPVCWFNQERSINGISSTHTHIEQWPEYCASKYIYNQLVVKPTGAIYIYALCRFPGIWRVVIVSTHQKLLTILIINR